ncbi:hypothetical protein C2869_04195 [Saccharobesus litoralis]|uniref:Uncharacterized protein n=1 Tax=Saccharobesus litoralis TaxID=2172099 RepID=A0A2S0VNA6_9ALTE|nr:hypothetical protein [Saccharobesus litoralis]AWB65686.1 hypothetical protein C2869_04195 [Saccharobesus litoralis]
MKHIKERLKLKAEKAVKLKHAESAKYFEFSKFTATTSLTMIAIMFVAKNTKVLGNEQTLNGYFGVMSFFTASIFMVSVFSATFITLNNVNKFIKNILCFSACLQCSVVMYILFLVG